MIENINKLIDSNLNLICKTHNNQLYANRLIDINGRKLKGKFNSELFADEMESRVLIKRRDELCVVTEFGYNIFKNGGWLNHLKKKEKEVTELIKNQNAKDKLELEIKTLTKDNLEYEKKIRNQKKRITNLEEQIKLINLMKLYWWLILACIGIGIVLSELWNLFLNN